MDLSNVEVTYKNDSLMYFKCTKYQFTVTVVAGISSAYYRLQLPILGTKFNIQDVAHHAADEIVVDNVTLALCHKRYPCTLKSEDLGGNKNDILKMIPKYKLGCGDLMTIMNIYEKLKSTISTEMDLIPFILTYVEKHLSQKEYKGSELPSCHTYRLHDIKCLSASMCRQVKEFGNPYVGFPYWSFGTRWSLTDEVLIGFLFCHDKVGTICLKDSVSIMGCVVIKDAKDDLAEILDKPVYIDKFCIFTEIFNPNTKFNLQYLYLKFEDIHVLGNKRKREITCPKFRFQITFLLVGKSNITYTQDRGSHFWIELADIKNFVKCAKSCFLCLPENLIESSQFLEVSCYYTMRYSKDLLTVRDFEYTKINSSLPQFMVKPDNYTVITSNREYADLPKLPFLSADSHEGILKTNGLVSFQAVLKFRKFSPSNGSRTHTNHVMPPYFGSIGGKTHALDFQVDKVKTLTLYLNNWERMTNPIGLVPGALFNVRNVMIQKSYCKSTAFTSLELVEYKPRLKFQTARLLEDDDWGPVYQLGGRNNVPDGILVHGVINKYKVSKMHMKRSCSECYYMSREPGDDCVKCKGQMTTVYDMLVTAEDAGGSAKICIKKQDIFRFFLGVDQACWDEVLKILVIVGQYSFQQYGPYVNYALNSDQVMFMNMMNSLVRKTQRTLNVGIHMLCRKLDSYRNRDKNQQMWYVLKARLQ